MKNFLQAAGNPTGLAALDELLLTPVATDTNPNCPGFDTLVALLNVSDNFERFCSRLGTQVFQAALSAFVKDCQVNDIVMSPFRFRVWIAAHGTDLLKSGQDTMIRRMMQDYRMISEHDQINESEIPGIIRIYDRTCELTKPPCPIVLAPVESGHASDISGPA